MVEKTRRSGDLNLPARQPQVARRGSRYAKRARARAQTAARRLGEAADVPAVSDADLHAGYTAVLAIAAVDVALERPKSIEARALSAGERVLEADCGGARARPSRQQRTRAEAEAPVMPIGGRRAALRSAPQYLATRPLHAARVAGDRLRA